MPSYRVKCAMCGFVPERVRRCFPLQDHRPHEPHYAIIILHIGMSEIVMLHPLYHVFMSTRSGEPTDYDLMLLDAILGLQPVFYGHEAIAQVEGPLQKKAQTAQAFTLDRSLTHARSALSEHRPRSVILNPVVTSYPASSLGSKAGKLFPIPLLKCPQPVFMAFVKDYKLSHGLVELLRTARRRKVNRKFQRVTRIRRRAQGHSIDPVSVESDDEGDCAEIDAPAVYEQLVCVLNFVLGEHNSPRTETATA